MVVAVYLGYVKFLLPGSCTCFLKRFVLGSRGVVSCTSVVFDSRLLQYTWGLLRVGEGMYKVSLGHFWGFVQKFPDICSGCVQDLCGVW